MIFGTLLTGAALVTFLVQGRRRPPSTRQPFLLLAALAVAAGTLTEAWLLSRMALWQPGQPATLSVPQDLWTAGPAGWLALAVAGLTVAAPALMAWVEGRRRPS